MLHHFIDIIFHLDQYLYQMVIDYGFWIYGLLFLIIFCETGLVITPFLPGDSLLFAIGAVSAITPLNVHLLVALLIIAALLGDNVNYIVGRTFGPKLFHCEKRRWFNPQSLARTQAFYEKYGGKTLIIARFMPIIRTFAPFVAGLSSMHYYRFLRFNIFGATLWIGSITYTAYWFGNLPLVKNHFSLAIVMIILISLTPPVVDFWRYKQRQRHKH